MHVIQKMMAYAVVFLVFAGFGMISVAGGRPMW